MNTLRALGVVDEVRRLMQRRCDELAQSRQHYAELFEGSAEARIVTSATVAIENANPAAGELFGRSPLQLYRKPLASLIMPTDLPRFRAMELSLLRGADRCAWDGSIRRPRAIAVPAHFDARRIASSMRLCWVIRPLS